MEGKRHIYFMPGLAASSKIFEYLEFDQNIFDLHYLEWLEPSDEKEAITKYASRYIELIKHDSPILVGVSFGGILVQEIGELIETSKIIIISSIKNQSEMPKRLRLIKMLRAYKIFPSRRLSKIDDFSKFDFHPHLKKKGELYNKYLSIRNEKYLNWALRNVLFWESQHKEKELAHIHGSKDEIFPIKHIKNCISIEGGTHAMIIVKAKKISKIIENILLA